MSFLQMFRKHNMRRATEHFDHDVSEVWWTNAIAGEAGEACNIAKKISRGDYKDVESLMLARQALAVELADVITYCDLLLGHMGYDTDLQLLSKFNVVSRRVSYPFLLTLSPYGDIDVQVSPKG